MDTNRLKAFLLSIQLKSFSKAAEELSYTSSALSHIADSIESELGIKIVKRNFNGIELTENGKRVYDKLLNLIDAEKELYRFAENLKSENQNLRIGAYSSISQHLLPDIIQKFKSDNPNAKVSIKVGNELRKWLKNDFVDVLFTDTPPENACYHTLLIDPFIAVAPKEILNSKKTVDKNELYNYPCIVYNESLFNDYFERDKFKEIIEFDSIDESSVLSMVEKNIGIAVLPALMLKNKNRKTHQLKLKPSVSRTIYFAYNKNSTHNACTDKFIKFIKKEFSV